MSQEAGTTKTSRPKRRSHFNPTIAGCIEGLRLALPCPHIGCWTKSARSCWLDNMQLHCQRNCR